MSEIPGKSAQQSRWAVAAIACGIGLIVLSLVWPAVSTGRSQWSDQQAFEYQRTSSELHSLSHRYAHEQEVGGDIDGIADELQSAQAEFDRLHHDLETAQQSPLRVASLLRFLGIGLIVLGVFLTYYGRPRVAA